MARPQTVVDAPCGAGWELAGCVRREQGVVKLRLVARLVDGEHLGLEIPPLRLVVVPDAVDEDDGRQAGLKGRDARGQVAAQGVADEHEAVLVDDMLLLRERIVHDGDGDFPPVGDEAQVLVAAHRRLAGPFVCDAVLFSGQGGRDKVVVRVLVPGVEAVADDHCRQLAVLTTRGRVPYFLDGKVALGGGNTDALARNRQSSDALVKGGRLLLPHAVDARIAPVAVEVDVGPAKVRCRREPRVPDVDGVGSVIGIFDGSFGVMGKFVEDFEERCHVSGLNRLGGAENGRNVAAASGGGAQRTQKIIVFCRVVAQQQYSAVGSVECCQRYPAPQQSGQNWAGVSRGE